MEIGNWFRELGNFRKKLHFFKRRPALQLDRFLMNVVPKVLVQVQART